MTRIPIPSAAFTADLDLLGQIATVVYSALMELLVGRLVPEGALPNLHAARRAAQSLVTHLEASRRLVDGT